jgi:hypothetical protein
MESRHDTIQHESMTRHEMKIPHDTTWIQNFIIFIVLVSIVASESYFNATNRVLTGNKIGWENISSSDLLKDWDDAKNKLQNKSWMYSIDWEEVTTVLSSNPSEMISEMN